MSGQTKQKTTVYTDAETREVLGIQQTSRDLRFVIELLAREVYRAGERLAGELTPLEWRYLAAVIGRHGCYAAMRRGWAGAQLSVVVDMGRDQPDFADAKEAIGGADAISALQSKVIVMDAVEAYAVLAAIRHYHCAEGRDAEGPWWHPASRLKSLDQEDRNGV